MKLIYFSDKKLDIIDPKYHGTGVKGAEPKRKINDAADWQDRLYFYKHGTEPEALFSKKPYIHYVEIPDEKIYDFRNDPKKLSVKTKYPNGSLNATAYEKAIKEAGYLGFHNGGHLDNIVAIFYPIKVSHIEDRLQKNGYYWDNHKPIPDKKPYLKDRGEKIERPKDLEKAKKESYHSKTNEKMKKNIVAGYQMGEMPGMLLATQNQQLIPRPLMRSCSNKFLKMKKLIRRRK